MVNSWHKERRGIKSLKCNKICNCSNIQETTAQRTHAPPHSLRTFPNPLLNVVSTSTGPAASPLLSGLLSVSKTWTLLFRSCFTSFSLRSSSFALISSTTSRTFSSSSRCLLVFLSQPCCSSSAAACSNLLLTSGSFSKTWKWSSFVGKKAESRA